MVLMTQLALERDRHCVLAMDQARLVTSPRNRGATCDSARKVMPSLSAKDRKLSVSRSPAVAGLPGSRLTATKAAFSPRPLRERVRSQILTPTGIVAASLAATTTNCTSEASVIQMSADRRLVVWAG
jgi:hypothetical protein